MIGLLQRRPKTCLAAALALALGFLLVDSGSRTQHFRQLAEIRLAAPAPVPAAGQPSGYAGGVRDAFLPLSATDGYQWIVHTQSMLAEGKWRVRRTDIDNYPAGREVHWSSSIMWWLALLATTRAAFTSMDLHRSVEQVALAASPLLLAVLLLLLALLTYRRFGAPAACALALAMATLPQFVEFFRAGYVDHHGLAAVAGMATVLFATFAGAGWVRAGTPARAASPAVDAEPGLHARRWMVASALSGAVGLWISAASQVPVLAGIGLGSLAAAVSWPRTHGTDARRTGPSASVAYAPQLWRIWGWAGAAGSLFFYLLEYFPSSMDMRLEVNHPLYAIAWAGAGELLYRACRRIRDGRLVETFGDRLAIPLALLAMAALPALIVIAPARFFWVSDPLMWTLHRDITEFQNILQHMRGFGAASLGTISILPLLAIPVVSMLWRATLDPLRKGMLAFALAPALVLTALGIVQVRWLGNAEALWIAALTVWVAIIAGPASGRSDSLPNSSRWAHPATAVLLAVVFLQFPLPALRAALREFKPGIQLSLEDRIQLVTRDVAQRIRGREGDRPLAVLTGPSSTTLMIYFGGFHGLGTLYWENLQGLRESAAIYGEPGEKAALARITRHGVTHIVSFPWEDFGEKYARLNHPEGVPETALSRGLRSPFTVPLWARILDYQIPQELELAGQELLTLEVQPGRTSEQRLVEEGDYLLFRGDTAKATASYSRALELHPDLPGALVGLADALARTGASPEVLRYLDRLAESAPPAERPALAERIAQIGGRLSKVDARAAVEIYGRALAVDPNGIAAANNLAWLLATSPDPAVRDGAEAVRLAGMVIRSGGAEDPLALDTFAAACAEAGRWNEAAATAERAVQTAEQKGLKETGEIRARLALYKSGQPYRQAR